MPTIKQKNKTRSMRAMGALIHYAGGSAGWENDDPECHLSDILADLMHFAQFHKIDFDYRLDFARGCFEEEKKTGRAF